MKKVLIVLFLLFLLDSSLALVESNEGNRSFKIVYITDLNLYPTPLTSKKEKHILEKGIGLLIYESQAIFLDLIRYLNKNEKPDIVVFGGDNISGFSEKYGDIEQDVWQLFLDMISELKAVVLSVFGKNELNTLSKKELVRTINRFGIGTSDLWWSYKLDNTLLIGLNSELFFTSGDETEKQIIWFKNKLNENKNSVIIVFMHKSLIDLNGNVIKNQNVGAFINILKTRQEMVLVVSGDGYLNRIKKVDNVYYILSPSIIAYPCNYKIFKVDSNSIEIKTKQIPLKGIIKKAEKSLEDSDFAASFYLNSHKPVRKHVLGEYSDNNMMFHFKDLSHR